MESLKTMPNIGEVIEKQLHSIGIYAPKELIKIGSKEAFYFIRISDDSACLHLLYALQGAIENKRYTELSYDTKKDLQKYYKSLKGRKL